MDRAQHIHVSTYVRFVLLGSFIAGCVFSQAASAQGSSSEWGWMGGNQYSYVGPTYGTEFEFAPANQPGTRFDSLSWTDKSGRLWLFGGYSLSSYGILNDLWVFDGTQGSHGEWAWMGGKQAGTCDFAIYPSGVQQLVCPSVNGTKYQFSDTNAPGSRYSSARWVDASGRLWLFGGFGVGPNIEGGALNDLWVFDPAKGNHGQWSWMGGATAMNCDAYQVCTEVGVLGTKYSFAAANIPSGRSSSTSWTDANGRFWLGFGGPTDLWVFDPAQGTHGEWAWMGGDPNGQGSQPSYGTEHQFSAANWPSSRDSALGWTDGAGRLWMFGGRGYTTAYWGYLNDLWTFDPAGDSHGEWAWMGGTVTAPGARQVRGTEFQFASGNTPGWRFRPTGWADQNGRLWLFGGEGDYGEIEWDLWLFDPAQGSYGEWAWEGGGPGESEPIYGSEYEFAVGNSPGSRHTAAATWVDAAGNLWLYGGAGADIAFSDLWEYIPPKPQTISFPALPSITYGAAPITLSATSSSGLSVTYKVAAGPGKLSGTNNSTLSITGGGAAVVVNAYQIGNTQYTPAPVEHQTRWILRAPLTVTADHKTMLYGSTVPALTWTPAGFVNGDPASVLAGSPTLSTIATSTSAPGTYEIRIAKNTLAAANYIVTPHWGTLTIQPLGPVAKPTFTLPTGAYTGSRKIAINDATGGAPIYYTTDGSTPSPTNGTHYTGVITVSTSLTLKAIAVKRGYTPSAIASATYTIQ